MTDSKGIAVDNQLERDHKSLVMRQNRKVTVAFFPSFCRHFTQDFDEADDGVIIVSTYLLKFIFALIKNWIEVNFVFHEHSLMYT